MLRKSPGGHGLAAGYCPGAAAFALLQTAPAADGGPRFTKDINVKIPSSATDKPVRYDYNIVYARAVRAGGESTNAISEMALSAP